MSGQVRSNFEINIIAFKVNVSDSELPQDSKYANMDPNMDSGFLLRRLELPKIAR